MELEGRHIPNVIKEQRRILDMSQIDLALKLGMNSTNHISLWEQGLSKPSFDSIILLTTVLGVSFEYLYREYIQMVRTEYFKLQKQDATEL